MANSWYSFSVTDVGRRRANNQDAIYANDEAGVWLVADGMGGHKEGEKASHAIVDAVAKLTLSDKLSERIAQLEHCVRQVNTDLQEYSECYLNGQVLGSTIVLFTVCQGLCAVIWAGDSRLYKISGHTMNQVTWDHSYVEEMVRGRHIAREEAAVSKLANVVTRAVGAHEALSFDHAIVPYTSGETFLLCSDGLTNELSDDHISEVVAKLGCSQGSIDTLLKDTLDNGARDNVSIIAISSHQRRATSRQELALIQNHTEQLNALARQFYKSQVDGKSYYKELKRLIDSLTQQHGQYRGAATQELVVVKEPESHNDTAPQPAIKTKSTKSAESAEGNTEDNAAQLIRQNYFLLLALIGTLGLCLLLLILVS